MDVLVLDTIHGGRELAQWLREAGHRVDTVDVYRGAEGIATSEALSRRYDRIVAPIHLDPAHPILAAGLAPVCSHHDAVAWLLRDGAPYPMVEITGARGKTTTAYALAGLMSGPGILHTSRGTIRYPECDLLWKASITPASVLGAVREANRIGGWLIAEESLGISGAGDLAVITSPDDYRIAAGTGSALAAKCASASRAPALVAAPGVGAAHPRLIRAGDVAECEGTRCRFRYGAIAGEFENPLLALAGYRTPLQLAAAAACTLGIDPSPLAGFVALPGRMHASRSGGILVVDNANSGANVATTIEAASFARSLSGDAALTLVIGTESRTICEGFPETAIEEAIRAVVPDRVIRVGDREGECRTLDEARNRAAKMTNRGSIVLSVKTWR